MDWRELKGRRVLVKIGYLKGIIDATVVEVSPSGQYVALRYDYVKHWHSTDSLTLLEVLG